MAPRAGTLFVVATPIGNLEDITARALRVLREVSVIASEDTRRTSHLLARYAIQTPMTSLHEHNEDKKTPQLLGRLERGDSIALVSDAGTPTVSDPGEKLIRSAINSGVRIEPIPGPSAVLAALAVSGLSGDCFTFMGFPPTRSKDRKMWFDRVVAIGGVVVFFEAPHRIRRTLEDLRGAAGNCRVSIGRELTKAHEESVRGPIRDVLENLAVPRGEFTIVAEIGYSTDNEAREPAPDSSIMDEFGHITNFDRLNRREALKTLAKKHSRPVNDIYAAIERAKRSTKCGE